MVFQERKEKSSGNPISPHNCGAYGISGFRSEKNVEEKQAAQFSVNSNSPTPSRGSSISMERCPELS